jgi:phospholipid/cholesterol/gamma-HCH transport system substrate-binding protein
VVNAPDAGAALQELVENAGPGLGSLVRNIDVVNKVMIPRLDNVEQMLVTYPDVVSGGFTVVRNDSGVMRAHFGFVLNVGDPHPCVSGYTSSGQLGSPGAVAAADTSNVGCDVVNGVDPNPGDDVDETGSNIRGEQNIGRSGGVAGTGPQSGSPVTGIPLASFLDDLLGQLLSANPFARTVG